MIYWMHARKHTGVLGTFKYELTEFFIALFCDMPAKAYGFEKVDPGGKLEDYQQSTCNPRRII